MTDADAPRPPDAVPGQAAQPTNQPIDEESVTTPLEDEEGGEYQVAQQPTGPDNMEGSGEWPHPATPPRGPAPGTAEEG